MEFFAEVSGLRPDHRNLMRVNGCIVGNPEGTMSSRSITISRLTGSNLFQPYLRDGETLVILAWCCDR
jgi:hypothetical protein